MQVLFDEIDDQIGLMPLPFEEREAVALAAEAVAVEETAVVRGVGVGLLVAAAALVEGGGVAVGGGSS